METIFLVMTIVPAGLLLIMLLLGDVLDIAGDVLGFDVDNDHGVGPLSLKLILAFIAWYGLGGYLCYKLDWNFNSGLSGLAFAVPGYLALYLLLRYLYSQRSNTLVDSTRTVGRTARVTSRIVKGKKGEIVTIDPVTNSNIFLIAELQNQVGPTYVNVGSEVVIDSVQGNVATVHEAG